MKFAKIVICTIETLIWLKISLSFIFRRLKCVCVVNSLLKIDICQSHLFICVVELRPWLEHIWMLFEGFLFLHRKYLLVDILNFGKTEANLRFLVIFDIWYVIYDLGLHLLRFMQLWWQTSIWNSTLMAKLYQQSPRIILLCYIFLIRRTNQQLWIDVISEI